MPLINCKVELKLKWAKYCVSSAASTGNDNGNHNIIIFTAKDTKPYVPVVNLSAKDNQKLLYNLSKEFSKDFIEINIEQKMRTKYNK